jgi:hypothetical protein
MAQSSSSSSSLVAVESSAENGGGQVASPVRNASMSPRPLSRLALGAGFSPLGINLMAATNLNRYLNLRATGNVFSYTANDISANGFKVDAKLSLASAGVSVDYYPFPDHGLRFSPGMLFYNNNNASATFATQPGTSFTLDNVTYYVSTTNPVAGTGTFGLHSQMPAFTMTTGWGNVIPRNGGHFSFPVEVGVALIGSPAVNVALTSGQACNAQGQNCVNVTTDPTLQANLQAQINKYKSNLDPLKTYPIVSVGVAYSFNVR